MYTTNSVINAIPATKDEAKVYQLYMVEYQCASILINHNHGIDDKTVRPNNTAKTAAQTVLSQMYFFPSANDKGLLSISLERERIFLPRSHQPTIVIIVQTAKNVLFRKPALCSMAGSFAASGLDQ